MLPRSLWEGVLVAWLGLLLGLAILVAIADRRQTRYAEALVPLHESFDRLRNAAAAIQQTQGSQYFMKEIQASVTAFAQTFSIITGAPCRACIKSLYSDDGVLDSIDPQDEASLRALRVMTFCRDELSSQSTEVVEEEHDYVMYNTDYKRLLLAKYKDRCFFANNLEKVENYMNTHWVEGRPREYLSTIVWPIQYRIPSTDRPEDRLAVEGFLAVDSLRKGIFDQTFDFQVGAAYADALYTVLILLSTSQEEG